MQSTPKVWKHADLATPHQRVAAWCQWFNLPEPDLPTDEEGLLLVDGLLDWLIGNSISIDWIAAGDPRGLAAAYARESAIMLALRAHNKEGLPFEEALAQMEEGLQRIAAAE